MRIGVVQETQPGETRVAATPKTVEALRALGYEVVVESGAGVASSFADEAYAAAGATIGSRIDVWQADIVFKVNAPASEEIAALRRRRDAGRPAEPRRCDRSWSRRWRRGRSRRWRWTPCRASRARSRWTC